MKNNKPDFSYKDIPSESCFYELFAEFYDYRISPYPNLDMNELVIDEFYQRAQAALDHFIGDVKKDCYDYHHNEKKDINNVL